MHYHKPPFPFCLPRHPKPLKKPLPPNVGSGINPIFIARGKHIASASTVGDSTTPVYLKSGNITECTLGDAYVAYSALKDGGGIVYDGDGNVYVDSSVYIAYTALLEGGGLAADDDGNVYVDFSEMDTTIFENLLKALEVPIYITKNKPFYVDWENGSDELTDGRGETSTLPFQTIQACVDYVTKYYAAGSYTIYIYVTTGTYNETLSLGEFTRSTGGIVITPLSGEQDVYITDTFSGSTDLHNSINCVGKGWTLKNLNIVVDYGTYTGSVSATWRAIRCGQGGDLTLSCVNLTVSYNGDAPDASVSLDCILTLKSSRLSIAAGSAEYPPLSMTINLGEASGATALSVGDASTLEFSGSSSSYNNVCEGSGTVTQWLGASDRALICRDSRVAGLTWNDNGVSGKKYKLSSGACCTGLSSTDFFPGDTDGTVDSSTYCFYS